VAALRIGAAPNAASCCPPTESVGFAKRFDHENEIRTCGRVVPTSRSSCSRAAYAAPQCGKLGVTVLFAVPGQPKSQVIRAAE
jgi:hypothetical protein